MQDKSLKCNYCKEPNGRFLTDEFFAQCRIESMGEYGTKDVRYTLCVNNSAWKEINYCPICGRKFK